MAPQPSSVHHDPHHLGDAREVMHSLLLALLASTIDRLLWMVLPVVLPLVLHWLGLA